MNPENIIEAVPALVKGGMALGGAAILTDAGKRILGPAADEFGERWRDEVRLYRYKRQLECVKKAEKIAREAGFTPKAVPVKLLFPLLEGASLEEDEELHAMWSALLANAASPEYAGQIRPGYIAVLRQLAPDEAALLNWIWSDCLRNLERLRERFKKASENCCLEYEWFLWDLDAAMKELAANRTEAAPDLDECISSLEAAFLLERFHVSMAEKVIPKFRLTRRGRAFIRACSPPSRLRAEHNIGEPAHGVPRRT